MGSQNPQNPQNPPWDPPELLKELLFLASVAPVLHRRFTGTVRDFIGRVELADLLGVDPKTADKIAGDPVQIGRNLAYAKSSAVRGITAELVKRKKRR